MGNNQYLIEFAKKCNVQNVKILRKANELLNLLESRKSVTCSESCKMAVCLELACSVVSENPIRREVFLKYSGCKKSVYTRTLNIISKLLDLDKVYSVREICLTLGVSEVSNYATKLLESYQLSNNVSKEQLEHPMYPCAAVIAACRLNKVRINATSVFEMSRIKKTELENLIKKIEVIDEEQPKAVGRKRSAAGNILSPATSRSKLEIEEKVKSQKELDDEYFQWKQKMLAE